MAKFFRTHGFFLSALIRGKGFGFGIFFRSVSSVLIRGEVPVFLYSIHSSFDIVCKCANSCPAVLKRDISGCL